MYITWLGWIGDESPQECPVDEKQGSPRITRMHEKLTLALSRSEE
jgi:hypothetical protein